MAVTGPSTKMKRRMMFCMVILCAVATLGILVRLFFLQVLDLNDYQRMAAKQQLREVEIAPKRGYIYDRNMKELAKSGTVWTVVLSPSDILDKKALDEDGKEYVARSAEEQRFLIADGLSAILGVDREAILEKSYRKTYYEIIKRRVDRDVADQVLEWASENNITCVSLEEDNKRYYPYGSLASTVLGFTNYDNQGAYGLEAKYDEVLSGTPGHVVSAKNAWGTDMPFRYNKKFDATDGNSIVLTIDQNIQHFVEKYLETAVKEHNVQSRATCIVMDPNTGEILAMATENDFDPNDPYTITDPNSLAKLEAAELEVEQAARKGEKAQEEAEEAYNELLKELRYDQWRNKAISDPYEPGSVFKLVTLSAALEEGVVNANSGFDCPGFIVVNGTRISCWAGDGRHGHQDLAHIVMNSCNPGFITVGLALGGDKFYDYYEAFGLTEKTGIDLPGEAGASKDLYYDKEALTRTTPSVELASSSFGQSHKETPIQLITAVSAAINGGRLMQPHIVKQILDADGNIIQNIEPVVKRQVISEETSRQVALMAERVVTEGSGKNAYIPGYRVGGKTGTSEKLDAKEDGVVTKRISSFLGFAPANDPQVICLLMLDEPYMANPYGSVIAAPVVGAILGEVLPYLGVEPQYTEAELANVDVKVPDVLGKVTLDAQGALQPKGLTYEVIGEGTTVIKQTPRAMTSVPKGSKVLLYTDTESISETTTVPNVVGMTAQQAMLALENANLNIKLTGATTGANTASKQSIEAGAQAEPGTVVTVQFISRDTTD